MSADRIPIRPPGRSAPTWSGSAEKLRRRATRQGTLKCAGMTPSFSPSSSSSPRADAPLQARPIPDRNELFRRSRRLEESKRSAAALASDRERRPRRQRPNPHRRPITGSRAAIRCTGGCRGVFTNSSARLFRGAHRQDPAGRRAARAVSSTRASVERRRDPRTRDGVRSRRRRVTTALPLDWRAPRGRRSPPSRGRRKISVAKPPRRGSIRLSPAD